MSVLRLIVRNDELTRHVSRRQVLVSLLNMQERFDWKACVQAEAKDKADVEAFKKAFAPFDPSFIT